MAPEQARSSGRTLEAEHFSRKANTRDIDGGANTRDDFWGGVEAAERVLTDFFVQQCEVSAGKREPKTNQVRVRFQKE
jgi:hypothetical protein